MSESEPEHPADCCCAMCEDRRARLPAETRRADSAEAELREIAGELEKATALLAQPCPWCLCTRAPAQPAAPTPDLPEGFHGRVANQLRAQQDRVTEFASTRVKPAAPEPSAGQGVSTQDLLNGERSARVYAESRLAHWQSKHSEAEAVSEARREALVAAEAQLAAVRLVVSRLRSAFGPVNYAVVIDKLEYLLTAPSPGAGGGK